MATDNIAKQLSSSWWWSPDDPATDDPYFEEMATQGQSFFSISGDNGAYTGNNRDDEGYPAEDVHITVVGGTELTTSGAGGPWQSEVAWNDDGGGSGGGPADDGTRYFPIQSWQVPVINSSNGGSTTLRNSPDVALQADYDNYICYDHGVCETDWGGTSFATPRWAAWLALVNQQLVANGYGAGLGFINPTLYSIGQSSNYSSDFHDVTSGNNDTDGQSKFYYAVAGYDLVTGWGSMNGQPLMTTLVDALLNYTLTVSTTGNGTVTSTDGFINCPGTCSHSYQANTQVTLNASPALSWGFAGWSGGGCSGTGSCNVVMTQNQTVSATFLPVYTLTVTTNGSGSVTSTDGNINCPGTCSHVYLSNTVSDPRCQSCSGLEFERLGRRVLRQRLLPGDHDAEPIGDGHVHPELLHANRVHRRQWNRHQYGRLHQLPRHVQPHLSFAYSGDIECLARHKAGLQRLDRCLHGRRHLQRDDDAESGRHRRLR